MLLFEDSLTYPNLQSMAIRYWLYFKGQITNLKRPKPVLKCMVRYCFISFPFLNPASSISSFEAQFKNVSKLLEFQCLYLSLLQVKQNVQLKGIDNDILGP